MYHHVKNPFVQKSEFCQKCHLRGFVPTATICFGETISFSDELSIVASDGEYGSSSLFALFFRSSLLLSVKALLGALVKDRFLWRLVSSAVEVEQLFDFLGGEC